MNRTRRRIPLRILLPALLVLAVLCAGGGQDAAGAAGPHAVVVVVLGGVSRVLLPLLSLLLGGRR